MADRRLRALLHAAHAIRSSRELVSIHAWAHDIELAALALLAEAIPVPSATEAQLTEWTTIVREQLEWYRNLTAPDRGDLVLAEEAILAGLRRPPRA